MNLEDQVIQLELARKLKELGLKQESYFYWYEIHDCVSLENYKWRSDISGKMPYSAFTVGKLGEMLHQNHADWMIGYSKENGNQYHIWFSTTCEHLSKYTITVKDENEANARARMLIYLIENKIININHHNAVEPNH